MKFLDFFDKNRINSGIAYYRDKKVFNEEKIDENLYRANVVGNDDIYDVEININNPEKSSCTCKDAIKGNMCKHMVALYLNYFTDELDEYIIENTSTVDDEFSSNLYDFISEALEAQYSHYEEYYDEISDYVYSECIDYYNSLLSDYNYDIEETLKDESLTKMIFEATELYINDYIDDDEDEYYEEDDYEEEYDEDYDEDYDEEDNDDYDHGYSKSSFIFEKDINFSRKDIFLNNYTNYYDKNGHKLGYSRKNYICDAYTNYYDEKGKKIGYSRKDFFMNNYTNYYDNNGKKVGTSRKDYLLDLYTNYYDKSHKRISSSRKDFFNSIYTKYKK